LQVTYGSDEAAQKSSASHCWGLDGLLADLCLGGQKSVKVDAEALSDEALSDAEEQQQAEKEEEAATYEEEAATYELTPPESFARLIESAKDVSGVVDAVLRLQVRTIDPVGSSVHRSFVTGGAASCALNLNGDESHNDWGGFVCAGDVAVNSCHSPLIMCYVFKVSLLFGNPDMVLIAADTTAAVRRIRYSFPPLEFPPWNTKH
jgi:hypothetical protein